MLTLALQVFAVIILKAKRLGGATGFLALKKGGYYMGRQQRSKSNNVNDLLTIKSSSSNNNDRKALNRGRAVEKSYKTCGKSSEKSGKDVEKLTPYQAEAKASALIAIFNAPNCREFFLKCVYHLPEQDIAYAVDYSTRPSVVSPVRYFNRICKTKLSERGL